MIAPVVIETLRTAALELPAPARAAATLPSGRLAVACEGLRPETTTLCTFGVELPPRAEALLQLGGAGEVHLCADASRDALWVQVLPEAGEGSLYLVDASANRPSVRLALEGARPGLVSAPAGLAFVDPASTLNLVDPLGHDLWRLELPSAPSAPVALGAHGFACGCADGTLRLVSPEGHVAAAASLSGDAIVGVGVDDRGALLAHDGERLWVLDGPDLKLRVDGASPGPMAGAPCLGARGAIYVLHREHGVLRMDAQGQRPLHWAEGLTCTAPRLDLSGATLTHATRPGVMSALLAWPPTPPGALHPISGRPADLPATPVALLLDPHQALTLCEGGQVVVHRVLC